jgi:hypothetical protein
MNSFASHNSGRCYRRTWYASLCRPRTSDDENAKKLKSKSLHVTAGECINDAQNLTYDNCWRNCETKKEKKKKANKIKLMGIRNIFGSRMQAAGLDSWTGAYLTMTTDKKRKVSNSEILIMYVSVIPGTGLILFKRKAYCLSYGMLGHKVDYYIKSWISWLQLNKIITCFYSLCH